MNKVVFTGESAEVSLKYAMIESVKTLFVRGSKYPHVQGLYVLSMVGLLVALLLVVEELESVVEVLESVVESVLVLVLTVAESVVESVLVVLVLAESVLVVLVESVLLELVESVVVVATVEDEVVVVSSCASAEAASRRMVAEMVLAQRLFCRSQGELDRRAIRTAPDRIQMKQIVFS